MPRHHDLLLPIIVLAGLVTAGAGAGAGAAAPRFGGRHHMPATPCDTPVPTAPPLRAPDGLASPPAYLNYPLYRWPLGRQLGDGLVLVNYVDHAANPIILDYSGGAHAYDGHAGIDYTLYNFRLMDRGCPIVAAAPGVVAFRSPVAPGAFDRNCGAGPVPDQGNWVWIDNGDGTYSEYYHLRSWSMTVDVGSAVALGDTLGYVGSSGYSTAPHLHFETGDYSGGPYFRRDPYSGPVNPLPSLWQAQEPYQGSRPLWFADLGVYTDDVVGGSVFNTSYCDTQEGIQAPVVLGIHEPHLNVWVQFQGNSGDVYRIEIVHPNGSVWTSFEEQLAFDAQFNWFWAYWFWDGNVSAADYGLWKLRAYANGSLSRERSFVVGPNTTWGPRLRRAGRSFRINGSVQRDTLATTPLSPAVTYALRNAPPFVSLSGPVLAIGPTSNQPTRSSYFQVVATDGASRADTAWYHIVDMSKPVRAVAATPARPNPPDVLALSAARTPGVEGVTFHFVLPVGGSPNLSLFDVGGRLVRRISPGPLESGRRSLHWDGRNAAGVAVSPGTYFARLSDGPRIGTARVVYAR